MLVLGGRRGEAVYTCGLVMGLTFWPQWRAPLEKAIELKKEQEAAREAEQRERDEELARLEMQEDLGGPSPPLPTLSDDEPLRV